MADDSGVNLYDISGKEPQKVSVAPEDVHAAVSSGRYSFPKGQPIKAIDENDEPVSIAPEDAPAAFKQGYRYATPEIINQQKYSSFSEQAKGAAEAAARAATLGLSTGFEKSLHIAKPEDIKGREEALSTPLKIGSEIAGLVGSSLIPGVGAANVLEHAGAMGAEALGMTGANALSKIGSTAVKGAIENGIYQGGNEVHKMIVGDPNQSVQTAIANVGLSGLIGGGISGGIGIVSPLWKATVGDKLGGWLDAVKRRTDGEPVALHPDIQQAMADASGIEMPPEIRAGMSDVPDLANKFNMLQESKTMPGQELQNTVEDFRKSAGENIVKSMGRDAENIASTGEISNFDAGSQVQSDLVGELKKVVDPITEQFDNIKSKFSKIPLSNKDDAIADKLANLAEQEGWLKAPGSPENKLYNDVTNGIPLQETLEDLRKFQSNLWSRGRDNPSLYHAIGKISNLLEETEMNAMEGAAGAQGEQHLADLALAKAQYKTARGLIEELNDRLHVGKYGGPSTFSRALQEMKPEEVISRLSRPNDAGILDLLQKEFPTVANKIREHQLSKLLGNAAMKARDGHAINTNTFFTAYDKMTPEMRNFVLPQGAAKSIEGTRKLLDALPKYKSSGTAGNLDSLWSKLPGGAAAIAAMITGHNPAIGFMLGQTAKWVSRDAPDAINLAMLKFLGKSGPVEPEAFKAMVDFIHNTVKGNNSVLKSIDNVFKAGKDVLPSHMLPDEKQRTKLDKRLMALQQNPEDLMNVGGKSAYYLDNHAGAFGMTAGSAVEYLNSIRPVAQKQSPLDSTPVVSKDAKANYDRALDIAEQPLIVTKDIKNGSLTNQDVTHLRNLYPALYQKMVGHVMDQIANLHPEDEPIPYKTRMMLSIFVGQPLDSTMTPQSILATQMATSQPEQPPMPAQGKPRGSMKDLSKMTALYKTPQQSRIESKSTSQA